MSTPKSYAVVGGAGFIGSHFVDALMTDSTTRQVVVFDNFSSGQTWHLSQWQKDSRLRIIRGEVSDLTALTQAIQPCEVLIHLASNPDIARAAREPMIDFTQGTVLTQNVVEAMRLSPTCKTIIYASGSGVYGDKGSHASREDDGPLIPVSTYGASKLAGEALIASYCAMFGLRGITLRFANVVGRRQTHGVGRDFLCKLRQNPAHLEVLGNGLQDKSYVHVTDVVQAARTCLQRATNAYQVFNVSTPDSLTVRDIATLACEALNLQKVDIQYGDSARGWNGDVPQVRLSSDRLRALGWKERLTSRQAMQTALKEMLLDAQEHPL